MGKLFAAINGDNTIKLWRSDGTLIRTFTGSAEKVTSLKFSPDSQLMAAIGDNKVDVWNSKSESVTTLFDHNHGIREVLFSPDSQRIATIDYGNVAKLWNRNGKQIATLEKHLDGVGKILFSPDSQLIASIGKNNLKGKNVQMFSYNYLVNLWSRNGKLIKRLIGQGEGIDSINFSPDSQIIASLGGSNRVLELWKRDGTLLSSIETFGVNSIHFSPDSKTIASIYGNKMVKFWKVDGTPATTFRGHNKAITSISFSPDSKLIASASRERTIILGNTKDEQVQIFQVYNGVVDDVSFTDEGNIVSVSNFGNSTRLKLWTLDGIELQTIEGNSREENTVSFANDSERIESVFSGEFLMRKSHVKLSSDRKLINSVSQDDQSNYKAEFWSTEGQKLKSIPAKQDSRFAFSPNGRMVAIATERNHSLKLWSMDGELLATIEDRNYKINSANISPDGKIIASASDDNTVKLWTRKGKLIKTLPGHSDKVNSVSFSPDGQIIASGSDDQTVKLWTREGELIKTLEHSTKVTRLMFSHNGKYIAATSDSQSIAKTIKLWTKDGIEIETIDDAGDLLSFSPDNTMLAFASSGSSRVSLYLLNGMWFKRAYLLTNGRVQDISFSPDSQSIAVAHDDEVSIVNWDIDELLKRGCDLARNHLQHNPNMKDKRDLCDGFD